MCGSSPSDFIRLNVSRQEMPASTRILVQALATIAQFPRLPLASIETHTLMLAAYAHALWIGSNFLIICCLSADFGRQTSDLGRHVPRSEVRGPVTSTQPHSSRYK